MFVYFVKKEKETINPENPFSKPKSLLSLTTIQFSSVFLYQHGYSASSPATICHHLRLHQPPHLPLSHFSSVECFQFKQLHPNPSPFQPIAYSQSVPLVLSYPHSFWPLVFVSSTVQEETHCLFSVFKFLSSGPLRKSSP